LTDADFEHFRQLVRTRSGLALTPEKAYLVTSRLGPIARAEALPDVGALLARLRSGAPEELLRRCVDAMATHESFFFRDGTPFDLLAGRVLPQLIQARAARKSLRIWCAACSSGQEPYSIAMILQEHAARLAGWTLEIVATDMSEAILRKAQSGLYSEFEVKRGLSEDRLRRWFSREGHAWRISPTLQQMVQFRPHNLLHGVNGLGAFDVIFCRNVLIYLEVEQKRTILASISKSLAGDGALFLGSAETVLGLSDTLQLTPGASGLFRPAGAPPLARSA
jgi:chemotaxis protein methyltransferase CheR